MDLRGVSGGNILTCRAEFIYFLDYLFDMNKKEDYKLFSTLKNIVNTSTESVLIDGREIIFLDKTHDTAFVKKIQALFVELLRDNIFSKQFPVLYIYFEPDASKFLKDAADPYAFAYVNKKDALNGERNVHFELKSIYARFKTKSISVDSINNPKIVEMFLRTLNHELTHVLHFEEKQIQEMEITVQQRLAKTLAQVQTVENKHKADIRLYLRMFLSLLHLEGLAKYCEQRLNMKAEMSRTYVELVGNIAKKETDEYMAHLQECIEGKIMWQEFMQLPLVQAIPYEIGDVMVMTILLGDHEMGIRKLTKLTTFEFIRKYEDCCVIVGFKPIVSLTSREGIFDYKKEVKRVGK